MGALRVEYLPQYKIEDYYKWEGDWELIKGIPYSMAPSPIKLHQQIIGKIWSEIDKNLECKECDVTLDTDYIVDEETVLRPDVAVVCNDFSSKITKTPEIIFEVVSPSTVHKDLNLKYMIYEEEKVKYYVLVFPNELIAKVYKLNGNKYEKVGSFREEKVEFDIECSLTVDFDNIFKRFKEKI